MQLSTQRQKLKSLGISLLILTMFGLLGLSLVYNAPTIKRLDYVEIKATNKPVKLGWQELGQRKGASSAEKEHLSIQYEKEGIWQLKNISTSKRVDVKTSAVDTRYLRRSILKAGDTLIFNTFQLQVKQADNEQLVLRNINNKQTAVWDGSALSVNNKVGYKACERQGLRRVLGTLSDRFHWLTRDYQPQKNLRLFSLGGQVACSTRWQQTDLPPDAVRFYWQNGNYWIGPGSEATRVFIERDNKKQDLKYLSLPTSGSEGNVTRLILGRTHYTLKASKKLLTLTPITNQQVFQVRTLKGTDKEKRAILLKKADEEAVLLKDMASRGITPIYKQHSWIAQSVSAAPFGKTSLLLLGALALMGLVYITIVARWQRQLHGHANNKRLIFTTIITLALSWAALAWRGELDNTLMILWISALWASIVMTLTGKLQGISRRLWLLALLLAGIGTLTLAQLAAGADNTRWLRYASGNILVISLLFSLISLLAVIPTNALNTLWQILLRSNSRFMMLLKAGIISVVVFLLVMQFAIGSEQGIWGIQPVEIAKLLIIFIAAYALWRIKMLRAIHSQYYRENPLARMMVFLWILFAFIIISLLIAVGVHDYSPTLIVMALIAAFLWQAIPHPVRKAPTFTWTLRSIMVLLPLATVFIAGLWFYQHPPLYDSNIPQAERLRIWANPSLFPEAASQLLNSLARVGKGGWLGNDWFGNNGISMLVPAIQDDFIGAFLLNRFGGLVGLVLLLTQVLWVSTLFLIAKRLSLPQANQTQYAIHNILGSIIFGLAWVHLLHWTISWGNVLGLLPIMGQPMTWLSAGNSHLFAIGVVTLLLAMMGSWMIEKDA